MISLRMLLFAISGSIMLTFASPALSGTASGADAAGAVKEGKVAEVRIFNVAFEPAEITVSPGTTVRWVNEDPVVHDVTSGTAVTGRRARNVEKSRLPDGRFRSGTFGKSGRFEVTFTEKGEYAYFCSVHPVMQGKVVVR